MNDPASARVLVADDEIFMRRLLEATFRKGNYDVVTCQSGTEALIAATRITPQLIVMDVMMPGLDGLAAIRQLKQEPRTRDIPVIVLSAKGQAVAQVEASEAGAALFLTKPFSPSQLLAEARRILAGSPPPAPNRLAPAS